MSLFIFPSQFREVNRVLESDTPEQGTEEWLEWRKDCLTASDAFIIAGNGTKGRERLLREKRGETQSYFQGNSFTQAGHDNEHIAVTAYVDMTGQDVHVHLRPVRHQIYAGLAASLDGITEDGINIEIKCLHSATPLKKPKASHVQQAQFQMSCTGLLKTHLVYFYLNVARDTIDDRDDCDRHIDVHVIDYDPIWFADKLPKFLGFLDDLNI